MKDHIGKNDGDQDAQLVDRHDHAGQTILQRFVVAQSGCAGGDAGQEEAPGLAADGGEIVVSAGDQHHESGEHQHHNGAQGCGYVGIGLFDAAFG